MHEAPRLEESAVRLSDGWAGPVVPDRAASRTVLVVHDHAKVNQSVCRVVSAEGYRTISAFNGPEALAAIAADPPDLVILDMSMPGMSGMDVLKAIRADPKTATLPVVHRGCRSRRTPARAGTWSQ